MTASNPYFTPLVTGSTSTPLVTSSDHTCSPGTYWIDEVQNCLTPDQIRELLQAAINTFNAPLMDSIQRQLQAYGLVEDSGPQILGIKLVPLGVILAGGALIAIAISSWLRQGR